MSSKVRNHMTSHKSDTSRAAEGMISANTVAERSDIAWKQLTGFVVVLLLLMCMLASRTSAQTKRRTRTTRPTATAKPKVDYSRFSHTTHFVQQKLACNTCH